MEEEVHGTRCWRDRHEPYVEPWLYMHADEQETKREMLSHAKCQVRASWRPSKGSGVYLLTGCRLHVVLRRGTDVADWRKLAHQMHGPGFGFQRLKGGLLNLMKRDWDGGKVPAAQCLSQSSDLASTHLHGGPEWTHGS